MFFRLIYIILRCVTIVVLSIFIVRQIGTIEPDSYIIVCTYFIIQWFVHLPSRIIYSMCVTFVRNYSRVRRISVVPYVLCNIMLYGRIPRVFVFVRFSTFYVLCLKKICFSCLCVYSRQYVYRYPRGSFYAV